ncbi:hypothetical protein DY000_02031331 [Brassica cretica]|uniref:Uncharacterized protein n=1 Tax=Brassica cretica TaxID=69181 RepID=A0ABQ7DQ39_BRACR|nr:hypothetical protein DY000_02031331 [Brassica cretica]
MSNSRNGELDRTIQLAVGEVGCSVSNSPNGELDQSCRASPSPSWINPEPGILVSGTPPFGTSTTPSISSDHDLLPISRNTPCSLKHIDISGSLKHTD